MKTTALFFALSLLSTAPTYAAGMVTVSIDGETYSCTRGGVQEKDCTVTRANEQDKYGTFCRTSGRPYCATFYEFGLVSSVDNENTVADAAATCRKKLARPHD